MPKTTVNGQPHPYASATPPPATFATAGEAEAWLQANYPNVVADFSGIAPELLGEFMLEFHELAQEYPEVVQRLRYFGTYVKRLDPTSQAWMGSWGSNTYAHASLDGRRIGLNPAAFGNAARARQMVLNDELVGHHVAGSGKSVASVLTHEFGHQVQNWLEATGSAGVGSRSFLGYARASGFGMVRDTLRLLLQSNPITRRLSGYATYTKDEGWAESFTALRWSPRGVWQAITRSQAELLRLVREELRPVMSPLAGNVAMAAGGSPTVLARIIRDMTALAQRLGIKSP